MSKRIVIQRIFAGMLFFFLLCLFCFMGSDKIRWSEISGWIILLNAWLKVAGIVAIAYLAFCLTWKWN